MSEQQKQKPEDGKGAAPVATAPAPTAAPPAEEAKAPAADEKTQAPDAVPTPSVNIYFDAEGNLFVNFISVVAFAAGIT